MSERDVLFPREGHLCARVYHCSRVPEEQQDPNWVLASGSAHTIRQVPGLREFACSVVHGRRGRMQFSFVGLAHCG